MQQPATTCSLFAVLEDHPNTPNPLRGLKKLGITAEISANEAALLWCKNAGDRFGKQRRAKGAQGVTWRKPIAITSTVGSFPLAESNGTLQGAYLSVNVSASGRVGWVGTSRVVCCRPFCYLTRLVR